MAEDINIGAISEALNNKADKDLNNTGLYSLKNNNGSLEFNGKKVTVVESFSNGNELGYIKFSNGLILQWGFTGTNAIATNYNVSFAIPFSRSDSYSVSASTLIGSNGTGGYNVGVGGKFQTYFSYCAPNAGSKRDNNCFWVAIGF